MAHANSADPDQTAYIVCHSINSKLPVYYIVYIHSLELLKYQAKLVADKILFFFFFHRK